MYNCLEIAGRRSPFHAFIIDAVPSSHIYTYRISNAVSKVKVSLPSPLVITTTASAFVDSVETQVSPNVASPPSSGGSLKEEGVKEKFPHLIKLEGMSEEQMKDLKEQLLLESEEIMEKFAVLVGKTISSCKQSSVSVSNLRAVLKSCSIRKVLESLDSGIDAENMWEKIADYWSFFDHKILSIIIKGLCKDLLQDLDTYVSDFKEYCKRRLCEVPVDSFSKGIHDKAHNYFNVKFDPPDGFFTSVANIDRQNKLLSKVLETEVRLCKLEDGCINFVYISLREFDDTFSLSDEQKQNLSTIGVLKMYSKTKVFYEKSIAASVVNDKDSETVTDGGGIVFQMANIQKEFEDACEKGNHETIKELLQFMNGDIEPETLRNGLFKAAEHGHQKVISIMNEFGANDIIMDDKDETGCTALIVATKKGQFCAVEELLQLGADPNIKEKSCGLCPLLIAIRGNDFPIVNLFLNNNRVKINISNDVGETALILAVKNGNTEIVNALLQKQELANDYVEAQDERGRTALHAAAEYGNMEIVKCLIDASPESRDITDRDGIRPVDIAKEKEEWDMVKYLGIEEDSDNENDQSTERRESWRKRILFMFKSKGARLMTAAKAGRHAKVIKLLKDGADPNTVEFDPLRWTPLMWASHRGHVKTVEVLLRNGADPNKDATNGFSALMLASRQGYHEVVGVLLNPKYKTEINRQNKTRGWTALMWASQSRGKKFTLPKAEENRRKVAELLLSAGADVNLKAQNGWTPLMQASQDGHTELVKIFCKTESIKIDHESKNSWTALTTACRKKRTDIIQVLVAAGADVNKKKRGGLTAAHITSYKGLGREAMETLVRARAEVDVQDEWGVTPLMLAVMQRHTMMTRYLIVEANANVNIIAERYCKWTAIFFAVKNKDQDTVKLLIEREAILSIKDECNHDILDYSKGLFNKSIYKYLSTKVHYTADEEARTTHEMRAKSLTFKDRGFYASVGALWRSHEINFYNI